MFGVDKLCEPLIKNELERILDLGEEVAQDWR